MWLFTRWGFFSVVRVAGEPKQYAIRARDRRHLDMLVSRFPCGPLKLETSQIIESPESDYRWRILVDHKLWSHISAGLMAEINYTGFKVEAASFAKQYGGDPDYLQALHTVWVVMADIQDDKVGKAGEIFNMPRVIKTTRKRGRGFR